MTARTDLAAHLASLDLPQGLVETLTTAAAACVEIRQVVAGGALVGALGASGAVNVQDEEQKKLDVIANDILTETLLANPAVAGVASEEMDTVQPATNPAGEYLVLFDPLDGSSNIDINAPVGTIVSVLKAPSAQPSEADFLQPGRQQVAALYAVYAGQAMLVLTTGKGVAGFTLAPDGRWLMTHENVRIPADTKEFAINMSNQRHWAESVQRYVDGCLKGADGPRGKNFNMRWVAAMVADVHRILMRGGVFLYPWDKREPNKPGKLRLMYEGNPMSFLVEQAGGKSTTDGKQAIMDVTPRELHQRVPVVLGSANEVDQIAAA
ncbi:class 1 fructose-bisphosphatase [Brevundimonas vancanneytii]|uniref:Fructose-1,6-bisphosphatase class 1 n=1 Tax=Brevundimonas vancanneytii TaxID=1325724 RepID=A0A4P1KF12_9CAUL|nr:class 1 fructose-bisphosphatase [Brevundimonas vancanneytii]VTO18039.1 Fructose-1,6-bisphosphatase class 1 [Brevundimonas vancanneytii]